MRFFLLLVALAAPVLAQRDFLRADEIDQVRLVQEPNERLKLYISFAQARLGLIEQAIAQEKPGRTKLLHDMLEDYTKIIEAIDMVSEDALKRNVDITEGLKAAAAAEQEMLPRLEKIRESEPKDIARYQFVLDQAIETTRDSAELATEDLTTRRIEVQTRAKKERDELEEMMKPEDVKARREAEKKEVEQKKKVPTLRRKGEVVKER